LKKLATKEELKKLATKEELKKLATKEELKKTKEELMMEIGRLELRLMEKIEEQDEKARQYRDEILMAVQRFAGDTQVLKEEMAIAAQRTENHEQRITALEQRVFAPK